jgi:hypothetical protein
MTKKLSPSESRSHSIRLGKIGLASKLDSLLTLIDRGYRLANRLSCRLLPILATVSFKEPSVLRSTV